MKTNISNKNKANNIQINLWNIFLFNQNWLSTSQNRYLY